MRIRHFAIIALTIVGAAACQPVTEPLTGNVVEGARDVCHQEVAKQLKAPSQASFEPADTFKVVSHTGKKWATTGWVDAPNSFGVKLRTTYGCFSTYLGGDNWRSVASLN